MKFVLIGWAVGILNMEAPASLITFDALTGYTNGMVLVQNDSTTPAGFKYRQLSEAGSSAAAVIENESLHVTSGGNGTVVAYLYDENPGTYNSLDAAWRRSVDVKINSGNRVYVSILSQDVFTQSDLEKKQTLSVFFNANGNIIAERAKKDGSTYERYNFSTGSWGTLGVLTYDASHVYTVYAAYDPAAATDEFSIKIYDKTAGAWRGEVFSDSADMNSALIGPENSLLFAAGDLVTSSGTSPDFILDNVARSVRVVPGADVDESMYKNGYLDVTKHAYRADNTGTVDVTAMLQTAMDDAYEYGYAVYFPSGTYRVSDTLEGWQHAEYDAGRDKWIYDSSKGFQLYGDPESRPVIKLASASAGFDSATASGNKPVFHIWSSGWAAVTPTRDETATQCMGNGIYNLTIDIGENNPGAAGIYFPGSQHNVIDNVKVFSSTSSGFFAGLTAIPGQGSICTGIEVLGADYGAYLRGNSRFPIIAGCRFYDFKKSGVFYSEEDNTDAGSRQMPLLLVGCWMYTDVPDLTAVHVEGENGGIPHLSMIDCAVRMYPSGSVLVDNPDLFNVFLENVYVKNVEAITDNDGDEWGISPVNQGVWSKINEYSYCSSNSRNLIDGEQSEVTLSNKTENVLFPTQDQIVDKHLWLLSDRPLLPACINVKNAELPGGNAVGDGVTDDTAALQLAIDYAHVNGGWDVFIPKGSYLITNTITLYEDTHLFGVGGSISSICFDTNQTFAASQMPMLTTVTNDNAETSMSSLTLNIFSEKSRLEAFDWKAGTDSVLWGVYIDNQTPAAAAFWERDMMRFSENAGGRVFGLSASWGAVGVATAGPDIYGLHIVGTTNPLTFYALNVEQVRTDPQVWIEDSRHVRIYQFKTETRGVYNGTGLLISGCDDVEVHTVVGNNSEVHSPVEILFNDDYLAVSNSTAVRITQVCPFYLESQDIVGDPADFMTLGEYIWDADGGVSGSCNVAYYENYSDLLLYYELNDLNPNLTFDQIDAVQFAGGQLSGQVVNTDPKILNLHVNTVGVGQEMAELIVQSERAGVWQFFWKRPGDAGFSGSQSASKWIGASSSLTTNIFNLSSFTNWTGSSIAAWRLDPPGSTNNYNFSIDSFIFDAQ